MCLEFTERPPCNLAKLHESIQDVPSGASVRTRLAAGATRAVVVAADADGDFVIQYAHHRHFLTRLSPFASTF